MGMSPWGDALGPRPDVAAKHDRGVSDTGGPCIPSTRDKETAQTMLALILIAFYCQHQQDGDH